MYNLLVYSMWPFGFNTHIRYLLFTFFNDTTLADETVDAVVWEDKKRVSVFKEAEQVSSLVHFPEKWGDEKLSRDKE